MRCIYVNPRYYPFVGGSERFAQEVSESLARDGHDVAVVTTNAYDLDYFWNPRRRRTDAPPYETLNGVSVHRVAVAHLPASSFVFQAMRRAMGELNRIPAPTLPFAVGARFQPWLPAIRDTLRSIGPVDLVHGTNLGLEGPALAALDSASEQRASFVLTPHVHLGTRDDLTARRYITMPHQRRLLRSSGAVIVQTGLEADFVASQGVEESRIVVAGSGVDPDEVTGGDGHAFRERHGIQGCLVGYLGALAEEKGARHAVLAVSYLRRAGHDVELVLAGPALEAFERWFQGLDATVREGIHLIGIISPDEKRDFLDAIDVFTLPSRTESFGIVYLEAWANRKPVVAAAAGGVTALVRDGVTGLLVEFGDVEGLSDALLRLLKDRELSREIGERGQALMMQKYTWPDVLARVRTAYSIALGEEFLPLER